MSCRQLDLAEIYDFSEGALDPDRRLAVEAHLRLCPDCRGAMGDVSRIAADLESVAFPVPDPSPGFRDRVLAGADVLLKRLAESGRSGRTARASPASHPLPGIDEGALLAQRPWYVRPIPRFAALAAAILVVLAGLALSGLFPTDRVAVASIRDIDGVMVNSATATGLRDLFADDTLETAEDCGGSFVSLCGTSVVLGAASQVVVAGRGPDGCLRFRLLVGRAWICTDPRPGFPGGVDVETAIASVSEIREGEAYLEFSPGARRLRVEIERGRARVAPSQSGVPAGPVLLEAGHALDLDAAAGGAGLHLGRASVDDVALAFIAGLAGGRTCAKRMLSHYDRAKAGPIHWVGRPEKALRIASGFRRPIFAIAEDSAIGDEELETDEAFRRAASRYVCVQFRPDTVEAEALLAEVKNPTARLLPRILLCPKATFMDGFAAGEPLSAVTERMEEVCSEVLNRVLSTQ